MLPLDSPRWSQLTHAYGSASDVPKWLGQLAALPSSEGQNEPWFSIWSALAHQGDVYEASYAAVPHVIEALAESPLKADMSFFLFPVWVEICRTKSGPPIPRDLEGSYWAALEQLPGLVANASREKGNPESVACLMAAIAVAHGQPLMAEVALELNDQTAEEIMEWLLSQ